MVRFIGDIRFCDKEYAHNRNLTINQYAELIINNWNKVVREDDKTFIVGSIGINTTKIIDFLKQLKGQIYIVANSELISPQITLLNNCEKQISVIGSYEFDDYIVTSLPVHTIMLNKYRGNIHGGLYNISINDSRYINVYSENLNNTPLTFNQLKKLFKI